MLKFLKKKGKADAAAPEAEAAAAPEGAEGAEGAAPKKKKLPLLFIIIPAALLVLGGGGGAAFFLMKPKPPAEGAAEGHGKSDKSDKKGGHGKSDKKGGGGHGGGGSEPDPNAGVISEGPDGVTFYTLPDLVTNIQTTEGRTAVLKLKLTLEMHDAHLAETLQADGPRMRDMFQSFLSELTTEDLAGSQGQFQLRAEILRRVNLIAAPGKVDAVLVEEMLVH